jgi:hypothetical protein
MRVLMNKVWGIVILAAVLVVGLYLSNPKRNLASDQSESLKMEHVQIKTEMIQSLQWQDQGQDIQFRIEATDPEFCRKWSQASIILAADGMGVSGDTPGARATVACQDGHFEMRWPKQVSLWQGFIEKTGDYIEVPEKFYVSSVNIEGPMGHMSISSFEIQALRNQLFELVGQK